MKTKKLDKLMNVLLGLASTAVLLGAFFKLQHYIYGNQILSLGLMASFVFSGIEIYRLKKRIKVLENETTQIQND